jgi:hypothetical protein
MQLQSDAVLITPLYLITHNSVFYATSLTSAEITTWSTCVRLAYRFTHIIIYIWRRPSVAETCRRLSGDTTKISDAAVKPCILCVCLLHSVQTGSWAQTTSYPNGTEIPLPGVKRRRREADHSPPANAEIKNDGAIPPLPQNFFAAWCLIN